MVFPSFSLKTPSELEADSDGELAPVVLQLLGEEVGLGSGESGSGSCLMAGAGTGGMKG